MTAYDYADYQEIRPYLGARPPFARLSNGQHYIRLNNTATAMLEKALRVVISYNARTHCVRLTPGDGHAVTFRQGQASIAAAALLHEAPLELGVRYAVRREGSALVIDLRSRL